MENAHQHELILNFQRMYCTVCLFLQSKLCEIRNEKQSKAPPFHVPHISTGEDCKKGPKKPPKGTPKPSSGPPEDTPKRAQNPVLFKNRFFRRKPPGGFGVCLAWDLEMGPRLYIDIYDTFTCQMQVYKPYAMLCSMLCLGLTWVKLLKKPRQTGGFLSMGLSKPHENIPFPKHAP